jgi:hypothetical protein
LIQLSIELRFLHLKLFYFSATCEF